MKQRWLLESLSLAGSLFLHSSVLAAPQQSTLLQLSSPPAAVTGTSAAPAATSPASAPVTQSARAAATPPVDLHIKSAGVEVVWLQDAVIYPYLLRAEPSSTGDAIVLSGYVPTELILNKALQLAQTAARGIRLDNRLVLQHNMTLASVSAPDQDQARLMKAHLNQVVPAAKNVQITVDGQGLALLSGRVDELTDRRKIIRALQGFPGCTAVRYDLRVGTPQTTGSVLTTSSGKALTPAATTVIPTGYESPVVPTSAPKLVMPATVSNPHQDLPMPPKPTFVKVDDGRESVGLAKEKPSLEMSKVVERAKATDLSQMTVSSLSGLTPPAAGISLGQPIVTRPPTSTCLIGMPVLMQAGHRATASAQNMELTQSVVQAKADKPAGAEPGPLPIIQLDTGVLPIAPAHSIEPIVVKPR